MSNRAVIYARYSSHNQREQSIEDQVNACKEYAENNNLDVVNVYADYAKTGRNDNREDFQQMLYDSRHNKFDVVLVWKTDRIGRDRKNILANRILLKQNNVELVSITEFIPDGPEGILIEAMVDAMAEYYSANLSQNIKRGLQSNAKKGLINGGAAPEGYKIQDQHYVIDEERAFIPRIVFQMADNGYSKTDIVNYLGMEGIKNKNGNYFNFSAIDRMLKNRKYIGDYIYSGTLYEGVIPPIIDKDVFYRVNSVIDSKKHTRTTKDDDDFILSGKVKCGECGANFTSESGTSRNGKVYKYYKCSTNKKHNKDFTCPTNAVRKEVLEDKVLQVVLRFLDDQDFLNTLAESIVDISKQDEHSSLKLNKKTYSDNQNKLNNLLTIVENGNATDSILNRISTLEEENKKLKSLIDAEEVLSPELSTDMVLSYLGEIKKELQSDKTNTPALLKKVIDSVIVYSDKLIVNLRPADSGKFLDIGSTYSHLVGHAWATLNISYSKSTISISTRFVRYLDY